MSESIWFYLDSDDQTIGPVSFRDIDVLLRTNEIDLSTYVWQESFENWKHIGEIPEFIQSMAENDMELALQMKPTELFSPTLTAEQLVTSNQKSQEEQKVKQKKQQAKHKKQKLKKLAKWYRPKHNTNLYISGLPKSITVESLKDYFSKAGVIRVDKFTGQPKIKLYQDDQGQLKGDALISYMNSESLAMAITNLDKKEIEPGYKIHLEPAEFTQKGEYVARKKVEVNKLELIKAKAIKERLTGWTDLKIGLRIVIFTNVFTLDTLNDSLISQFKNYLQENIGEIERLREFKFNPDGVVEVKFKNPSEAEICIQELNETEYNGRVLKCFYWDGRQDYRRVRAMQVNESKEEEEKRIKEFGEWLEVSDSDE